MRRLVVSGAVYDDEGGERSVHFQITPADTQEGNGAEKWGVEVENDERILRTSITIPTLDYEKIVVALGEVDSAGLQQLAVRIQALLTLLK